jgi:hypothetical protein
LDESREYKWDSDASRVLGGVGDNSPTVFVPGFTNNSDGPVKNDRDITVGDGEFNEQYIDSPSTDDGYYGSGTVKTKGVDLDAVSDWITKTKNGNKYVVDPPRPDGCGNGVAQATPETTMNCPTDMGMSQDVESNRLGDMESKSVSKVIPKQNGEPVYKINASNRIEVEENSSDIECNVSDCPKLLEMNVTGSPDFFINSSNKNQLIKLTESTKTKELGSVRDHYFQSGDTQEFQVPGDQIRSVHTECEGNGCIQKNLQACRKDSQGNFVRKDAWVLVSASKTLTADTSEYHTESSGTGYNIKQDSKDLRVGITYNESNKYEVSTCDKVETITHYENPSEPSNLSNEETYYETRTESHYSTLRTKRVEFNYEVLDGWNESLLLDVNKSTGPSKQAVAHDYERNIDYFTDDGEGYFSVEPKHFFIDNVPMENDPAIGFSSFDLTTEGHEFATVRTERGDREPDGKKGQREGLVAINEEKVRAYSDEYILSGKPGVSRLDRSDYTCENGYTKCVKLVDIYYPSADKWNSTSPSLEHKIVSTAPTGRSLSVCKIYQRLGGDISCTYKYGSSPLPDGPYSDEPGEWRNMMKGPEIDDSYIKEYPLLYEGRINENNSCVFHGSEVPDQTLADVTNKTLVSRESGEKKSFAKFPDRPRQEICVNADDQPGGSWYDYNSEAAYNESEIPSLEYETNCGPGATCDDHDNTNYFVAPFKEGLPPAKANPFIGEESLETNLTKWYDAFPFTNITKGTQQPYGKIVTLPKNSDTLETNASDTPPSTLLTWEMNPTHLNSIFDSKGVHNKIQAGLSYVTGGDSSSPGDGTGQAQETNSIELDGDESMIQSGNDNWAITSKLTKAIGQNGRVFSPQQCHAQYPYQFPDYGYDKPRRAMANSYVAVRSANNDGASECRKDGIWVDPDETTESATKGGTTCDLTGRDLGYAVEETAGTLPDVSSIDCPQTLYESGGPENGQITEIEIISEDSTEVGPASTTADEKASLVYEGSDDGGGGGGGVSPATAGDSGEDICLGANCPSIEGPSNPLDDDNYVDQNGDGMSGTLHTEKIERLSNDIDLCIGPENDCGSIPDPAAAALNTNNTDTSPEFRLSTEGVKPLASDLELCTSSTCPN